MNPAEIIAEAVRLFRQYERDARSNAFRTHKGSDVWKLHDAQRQEAEDIADRLEAILSDGKGPDRAYMQHVAYVDEGEFNWMAGIAPRDCELYAVWGRVEACDRARVEVPLAMTPPPGARWRMGDYLRKVRGSLWRGRVVGFYSTENTPVGYAIESAREPGSVQVWPEAALEPGDPLDDPGWIVGNGNGTAWRAWRSGLPEWVTYREDATRYSRREDAEAVHAEDEDSWQVVWFDPGAGQ